MIGSELSFEDIVVEVRYNDSSIGMIHQDYLVTRSNISIRIEVSPLIFYFHNFYHIYVDTRPWMPPGHLLLGSTRILFSYTGIQTFST